MVVIDVYYLFLVFLWFGYYEMYLFCGSILLEKKVFLQANIGAYLTLLAPIPGHKGLHKTFWGTTKKSVNKNLS